MRETPEQTGEGEAKRPYEPPVVTALGSFAELTLQSIYGCFN